MFESIQKLIAARALATHLIPGCVGRGVRLESESSSGGGVWARAPGPAQGPQLGPSRAPAGPKPGPSRAQAGSKPGPSWAQAGPKPGPSQKFGTQHKSNKKILKIKIRVAQNVGKVWIGRKKKSWPHLGPSGPIFCEGRKNAKNVKKDCLFPLVGQ